MPAVDFTVRWPDGTRQRCQSPSTAIEAGLVAGASYGVDEFLRRTSVALAVASARVRERYGFACSAADAQRDELGVAAARHRGGDGGRVTVERMRRVPRRPMRPVPERLDGHRPLVIVGGGQAGLALSACVGGAGVEHLVLERNRVGHSWREERWDSFCLVTPNFQCRLPGMPYDGGDPDGFMGRDEVVAHIEEYARRVDAPIAEGVEVRAVTPGTDARFALVTSHGTVSADAVALAVGGYHRPSVPRMAGCLPERVTQLHSSRYRNPGSLPDGAVLVVGSGQSGAQIAEDLLLAGRDVHLSVGGAPRVARRYRGRDCVAWLEDMGHYDISVDEHPEGTAVRREANHYVTGRGGGRDIDLRAHARDGMRLHGRLEGIGGARVRLAGDLRENLDAADATSARIKAGIDAWIAANGVQAPPEAPYRPVWTPPASGGGVLDLDAAGISTVVWATGFRSDWSWVHLPAFDGTGYPMHHRGVTSVPGLYVLGLPWLHTWGSGRFAGVGRDAEHLAEVIGASLVPAGAGAAAAAD